jgi:hypothetical protein
LLNRTSAASRLRPRDGALAAERTSHIFVHHSRQSSGLMPVRLRKLIGAVALILLVVLWALVAMALAQSPALKANGAIEVLYYVVAGLGWVPVAMPLVKWMSGGRRTNEKTEHERS